MKPTKAELENKYGVPVFTGWHLVPANLRARNYFKKIYKVVIPEDAKPDGIKGGGTTTGGKGFYFLFDENKYLPADNLAEIQNERNVKAVIERPTLKVNYER